MGRTLLRRSLQFIMDEPMSSLDFSNQAMILKIISSLSDDGKTIVIISDISITLLPYPHRYVLSTINGTLSAEPRTIYCVILFIQADRLALQGGFGMLYIVTKKISSIPNEKQKAAEPIY